MDNRRDKGSRSRSPGRSDRGGERGSFGGGNFRGGGNFDRGPREMHAATCAECGCSCEVPFKPTEGKPVYCRDCFRKKNPRF